MKTFEPVDPVSRVIWLFNDWNPAIPEPQPSTWDLAEKKRESAIRDLLKTRGADIVFELASKATHPELVGAACGNVLTKLEDFVALVDSAMGETDNLTVFASVLSAEAERHIPDAWRAQIRSWRAEKSWTDRNIRKPNLELGRHEQHLGFRGLSREWSQPKLLATQESVGTTRAERRGIGDGR